MKPLSLACSLALGLVLAAPAPLALAHDLAMAPATPSSATAPKLHTAMRTLWQGHVTHTTAYTAAVKAGDQAAAKKAADDVVANAKQIADAVAGFYGKPAGEQMLKLLAGHWGGVKAYADAAHSGDKAGQQKAMQDLAGNATAIAKFLSGANPNLPEATVDSLMMMHVSDHQMHIDAVMAGDKAAAAKVLDHMRAHMNTIADALAGAIAKQFPDKAS
jgi:DNA-binding GntR family transcriptional regulator